MEFGFVETFVEETAHAPIIVQQLANIVQILQSDDCDDDFDDCEMSGIP